MLFVILCSVTAWRRHFSFDRSYKPTNEESPVLTPIVHIPVAVRCVPVEDINFVSVANQELSSD